MAESSLAVHSAILFADITDIRTFFFNHTLASPRATLYVVCLAISTVVDMSKKCKIHVCNRHPYLGQLIIATGSSVYWP